MPEPIDPQERIQELTQQAYILPYGATKVSLLEEAVRLSDSLNDIDQSYELRHELMSAANFSGREDLMLIAFAWCLGNCDRDPERFNLWSLLWKYKWVCSTTLQFPDIPWSKLESLHEDMVRRFEAYGASMHAPHLLKMGMHLHRGDLESATVEHSAFSRCQRDSLSNCPACVVDSLQDFFIMKNDWERAIKVVDPVLNGSLSCATQPHRTLANSLLPLLHLGRFHEAEACRRKGYFLIRNDVQLASMHAMHLRYAVLTDNLAGARRMVERHLPGVMNLVSLRCRYDFYLSASLWAERLIELGTEHVKLTLPAEAPQPESPKGTSVMMLRDWLRELVTDLASRFDARNGTRYFQQRIDQLPESLQFAADLRAKGLTSR